MTIVVAQRFGDRIMLLCDTMVSDSQTGRDSIVPGRLKSVVLSATISVGYAGFANQCIDAVRQAFRMIQGGCDKSAILSHFVSASASQPGRLSNDYIVASHCDGAELFLIKNGRLSKIDRPIFVGEPTVFDRIMAGINRSTESSIDYVSNGELQLANSFTNQFIGTTAVDDGVGGVPISLMGSPYGHTYNNYACVSNSDTIIIGSGPGTGRTSEHERRAITGETEWRFNVNGPERRGVPVAGLYCDQIQAGFIYMPIQFDEPVPLRDIGMAEFFSVLNHVGQKIFNSPMHLFDQRVPDDNALRWLLK